MSQAETHATQLAYIRRVLALTGWNQTMLAKRAGLDPSTLSRFLSNSRDDHLLRGTTITRIGEVTGIRSDADGRRPQESHLSEEATSISVSDDLIVDAMLDAHRHRFGNVETWRLHGRALEQAGFFAGDVLFVSPSEHPLAGDIVRAQYFDFEQQRAQTVFRVFHPPFLVAATSDPALLKPLPADDDKVAIGGVVVGSYRMRRSRGIA